MTFTGIDDSLHYKRLGAQFRSAFGYFRLDEAAGNDERRVETAIIGFGVGLVKNRFQSFQQDRQRQRNQRPGDGGADRTIVDQIDRQHKAAIERGMDGFDMFIGDAEGGKIVPAEMLPDQSE
ncbi:hypothetical protein D3C87_1586290 [compost metagenome]